MESISMRPQYGIVARTVRWFIVSETKQSKTICALHNKLNCDLL